MNKVFCDICGNEILANSLAGGVMRVQEVLPVIPIPKIIGEGGQAPPGMIVTKKRDQEVWDLCENCQKFLWVLVLQRKENLLKKEAGEIVKSTLVKKP